MNGPNAGLLALAYVRTACEADSRVREVTNATYAVKGDVIEVSIDVVPVTGSTFTISGSISSSGAEIS